MNERKTEDMVESWLRANGYYQHGSDIIVEKQKSETPRIQKLLENASKSGSGVGKPEFIIRCASHQDFLVVVECKADPQKHISPNLDRYAEYAVDGVLLYASFFAKEFDVLAIAVSGQTESNCRISHYIHLRHESRAVEYKGAKHIVSLNEYYDDFVLSEPKVRQDYQALLDYSRALNDILQAKKVTEADRALLVSGILIALQNRVFRETFQAHSTAKQIAQSLLGTVGEEFENAGLPHERREMLRQCFSFISGVPALIEDRDFLIDLIKGIEEHVNGFMRTHKYYDTIGQFYVEFLRYANNDKGLGIVLTPLHITDLLCAVASVNKDSIVFDNCCGTGGLLIAAMRSMMLEAGADSKVQQRIKNQQLIGIESQPKIYALAVSNMILHNDGKTNVFRGNCFTDSSKVTKPISDQRGKPNVGLLNPPYKNKTVKEDKEELEFVFNNLEHLESGGTCAAIVPITCATAPSGKSGEWKRALMERHTLEAVMSMPIESFHNSKTTVVTCIIVFTAHRPHPKGKKTWFGYCRDDGFVKTKHRGRIDANGNWFDIRSRWINAYRSREVVPGLSITKEVGPWDEWCAEAYLDCDYDLVTREALLTRAKRYILENVMLIDGSE